MIAVETNIFEEALIAERAPATSLAETFHKERQDGATFREIGENHGVSHERVRQVLESIGVTFDRNHTATVKKDKLAKEVTGWLRDNGPVPTSVVCEHFALSPQRLSELVDNHNVPRNMIMSGVGRTGSGYTDDTVVTVVKAAWARLKAEVPTATGLSVSSYDRVRLPGDPSPALITGRRAWREVCQAAEVPCGAGRPSYTVKWTDQDLFRWIHRYATSTGGGRVTFDGYDLWRKTQPGAPSGALVRTRLRRNGYPTWASMVTAGVRGDAV